MLPRTVLLSLFLLTPLIAAAQGRSDLQQILDRLDRLEQENRNLADEVRALRSELAVSRGTTPAPVTAQADAEPPSAPLPERVAVTEQRTADLSQSKVEAGQRLPLTLTGMVLFNAFLNGSANGGFQAPLVAAPTNSVSKGAASLSQSIVGLRFQGPRVLGGGQVRGTFDMDLWGGSASSLNHLVRLRVATVQVDWKNSTITVGQDKPIIAPRDPDSLSQVAYSPLTSAGNLWLWQPQIRFEQRFALGESAGIRAQAGVYQTSEPLASAGPEYQNTLATARPALQEIGRRWGGNVKVVEVPPGPPVLSPIVAEVYGPEASGRQSVAKSVRAVLEKTTGLVDVDDSSIAAAPKKLLLVDRQKAARLGVPQQAIVSTLRAGLSGESTAYVHDQSKYPASAVLQLPATLHGDLSSLLQLTVRSASGKNIAIRELISVSDTEREQPVYHKDLLPVNYVVADAAGGKDSPLYGMFAARAEVSRLVTPSGSTLSEFFIRQPEDPYRGYSLKWDGESQVTYETFRDMGAAYGVGLILIYLLVVAQFRSYLTPLIIMAPIPLTLIGVMPGHALLGAQFTATSMIGMIALAGIIVRNSILLVDFIELQVAQGRDFAEAVVDSARVRAQPIALTALAAMIGALFILDDPIFNGLAIALIFGILVSTLLTLVVIPLLYFVTYRGRHAAARA